MKKPNMVIMAAGMGSRYGGLKQIEPMGPNGETLIEYSVYDAIRAGFGKVIFIIRKEFEQAFREQVSRRFESRIEVAYAFQELDALPAGFCVPEGRRKPWGTAHAVLTCNGVVDGPFSVQNADDYYGIEAFQVIADALKKLAKDGSEGCMVGFETMNTLSPHGAVSRGICQTTKGYLTQVDERQQVERNDAGILQYEETGQRINMRGDEICSLNFWGFSPAMLQEMEGRFVSFLEKAGQDLKSEWQLPVVIDSLIKERRLRVKMLNSSDRWYGVTYPEDKATVVSALKGMHEAGNYPAALWAS